VTLFGESSGAVSVHALYLSPLSAGLFSAAIAQSGTMLMTRTTVDRKRQERTALNIARYSSASETVLLHFEGSTGIDSLT
jgi:carboxylesterase type B